MPVVLHIAALKAAIGAAGRPLRQPFPLLPPILLPVAEMAPLAPAVRPAGPPGAVPGIHDAGSPTSFHTAARLPLPAVPKVEARLTALGASIVRPATQLPQAGLVSATTPAPVLPTANAVPLPDAARMVAAAQPVLVAPMRPIRPRAGQTAPVVRASNPPRVPPLHTDGSPQAMDVPIGLRVPPVGVRAALLRLPVAARVPVTAPEEGGPPPAQVAIRPGTAVGDTGLAALAAGTAPTGFPGA